MMKFTINKGNHYCNQWWKKFFRLHWNDKKWLVDFKLTNDCWWIGPRNSDDYDLNKLIGIGYGINHHKNSWRLTWVPDFSITNKFYLYAYAYDPIFKGHVSQLIGEFYANTVYTCEVESFNGSYCFDCKGVGNAVLPNETKDCKLQFELLFYHGGNNTAPNDETCYCNLKAI
jgi:hypothetical protein